MAPLSWRHHALVQALLTHGPLSERDFHISGKNPGAHLFSSLLFSSLLFSSLCAP
jgi:hypothetical protein